MSTYEHGSLSQSPSLHESLKSAATMAAEHPFNLRVNDHGNALDLVIEGELDVATAPALLHRFQDALDPGVLEVVYLDASDLDFVDSTGLSVLVLMRKRALADGTKFMIRSPNKRFLRLLEVTGLNEYFEFAVTSNDDP